MKIFFSRFIFCGFLSLIFTSCDQPAPNEYGLVWEDEFNGSTLDNSKWTHQLGDGSQFGLWGWGNGELQYYKQENTTLADGVATITVKEESVGDYNYTSSRITTKDKFSFRYGKVEARIKTVDGQGFWPAFWLLPEGGEWPCDGEIDIMEQGHTGASSNVTTGAAHLGNCPYDAGQHQYVSDAATTPESFANDFHVYGIQWGPDYISWFVDDEMVFQVSPEDYNSNYVWPFNASQWYIILNLAITPNFPPNNQTLFPSEMQIDWVRVFSL